MIKGRRYRKWKSVFDKVPLATRERIDTVTIPMRNGKDLKFRDLMKLFQTFRRIIAVEQMMDAKHYYKRKWRRHK